jgi:hypothetical protein
LVPTFDGGDDIVWVSFPDERPWLLIVFFDEAVDGCLKVDDGVEDAMLQPPACQFCEETLDGVQPGA